MAPEQSVERLEFANPALLQTLAGEKDANLRELGRLLKDVAITARGNVVQVQGERLATELARLVLEQLYGLLQEGYPLYRADIDHAVRILKANRRAKLREIFLDAAFISSERRVISPKSIAQKGYIDAIRHFDIVFGIGPAGTGKTYLAMAMAVAALTKHQVKRIILTRPAVEAGEKLGFLPGNLFEKVNPYLRPLYDALHDMMDFEKAGDMLERGVIEVAPLAFMRGRTLNDSFVILDEAQNTTSDQMKMFLTRLGFDSKAVITGDVTQTDLPPGRVSGLVEVQALLKDIQGIRFCNFTRADVVRHPLVQEIIEAYESRAEGAAVP
jgi:phosphate starvation-inducible PhoH-like protein